MGLKLCTYMKGWLAKQKALFVEWVTYSRLPLHVALHRENLGSVVVWCFEDSPSANTNQFQGILWSFSLSIEDF